MAAPTSSSSFPPLHSIPPALRPLVRAYLLGYASAVLPRLLTLVLQHLSHRKRTPQDYAPPPSPQHRDDKNLSASCKHVLKTALHPCRFPTFCAALVGGSTLLQIPLHKIITRAANRLGSTWQRRLTRSLASFIAAWLSLQLLQAKEAPPPRRRAASATATATARHGRVDPLKGRQKLAGRTIDLTLFAATQAVDVVVGELWARHKWRRQAAGTWTKAETLISAMTDPVSFVASSALIMWAWCYAPSRLPRAYNKWITSAAQVDIRLIEALRRCRNGDICYAKDTGQAPLLGTMCTEYNLPYEWGDPAKSIPFPCDIVHMGRGPSCEYHAWRRFWLSWTWAMYTYLPLTLALQLRKPSSSHHDTVKRIKAALLSACRSSAFLGTYIALFYYGVCLGRTRLGPRLLGKDPEARQRLDSGYCVGAGCFLCGWSVLIETARRRRDMALFVAPRAMATLLPRRYPLEMQWRETLAFAASTAVVFTCAMEKPNRVRGMLGGLLSVTMRGGLPVL
ncbi:hypothetical protein E4U43_001498 [Claviceps pusilla]|uniref:Integral membrane protein n=1 Tax=Claviceps pusilla TaxID=123648 RepID=A0A9P7N8E8_9HYPO|nr:hypothetical protein E4U43_001498 [Claviceps pusilla]